MSQNTILKFSFYLLRIYKFELTANLNQFYAEYFCQFNAGDLGTKLKGVDVFNIQELF